MKLSDLFIGMGKWINYYPKIEKKYLETSRKDL